MLSEKGGTGFPFLVFLNEKGDVIAKQRARTVEGFKTTLERLSKRADLAAKASAGSNEAKIDLLMTDMELGGMDFAKASEQAKGLKMTPAQEARWNDFAIDAEFATAIAPLRSRQAPADALTVAGAKLREMKAKGRIPKGDTAPSFWMTLINADLKEDNVEAAEANYAELEKLSEAIPSLKQQVLPGIRKRIDALKNGEPSKNG